jgi:fermentation-respiration switch protein FrsA (DUF1100 family)
MEAASPWNIHLVRYDIAGDLAKVQCPVLALNGEKDCQVDADMNLTAIRNGIGANGNKEVTTKVYPGLNHLFQHCTTGSMEEYSQIEETISPEVLKDMTGWIRGLASRHPGSAPQKPSL